MVMQYCPRGELYSYYESGLTLRNERLCKALFVQVLQAVHFMHHVCNIAHLDIKLENIVLDETYALKLIDFGFSE